MWGGGGGGGKKVIDFFCFVYLFCFLTSSSTTRLYRGRSPRQSVWQFYVLPHMRQSWETMTSVSAGHIILTTVIDVTQYLAELHTFLSQAWKTRRKYSRCPAITVTVSLTTNTAETTAVFALLSPLLLLLLLLLLLFWQLSSLRRMLLLLLTGKCSFQLVKICRLLLTHQDPGAVFFFFFFFFFLGGGGGGGGCGSHVSCGILGLALKLKGFS